MKQMFSEYFYNLDDAELKQLWNNCIFVFDTNILLNLYRYSEETRNTLFLILERIKKRIWLPHQIGYEYNKNRLSKIKEVKNVFDEAINAIQKPIEQVKDKLMKIKYPSCEDKINSKIIKKIDDLQEEIIDVIEQDKKICPDLEDNDFIRERLCALYEDKVGVPYDYDKLKLIYQDGKQRYEMGIPPGYEDAKDKNGNEKYGDLIVWKQVIDKSKEVGKPIIFITDDKKEDWWWIVKGERVSLRSELIKEFIAETEQKIWMYTAERFMKYAKDNLKISIAKEVISELKEAEDEIFYDLTERELEVLKLIIIGKNNSEIANELFVSTHTAKTHILHILQKLEVNNRIEAAVKALQCNLISHYDL